MTNTYKEIKTWFLTASQEAVAPSSYYFSEIQSAGSSGTSATVNGEGIFVYLSANNVNATKYINPETGVAFTAANNPAGSFEALPDTDVVLEIAYGKSIYGKFTNVITDTAAVAYMYI